MARERAEELYEQFPEDPAIMILLAEICTKLSDFLTAARLSDKLLIQNSEDAERLLRAGDSWLMVGEYDKAVELSTQAKATGDHQTNACLLLVNIYSRSHQSDLAWEVLSRIPVTKKNQPNIWSLTAQLHLADKEDEKAHELLQNLIRAEDVSKALQLDAWFTFAKIHDKNGEYDEAWAAATKAHEVNNKPFSLDQFHKDAENQKSFFTKEMLQNLSHASNPVDSPVLIMGNPRSGTSLLEQILSMHPDVSNAGELSISSSMMRKIPLLTDSFLPFPKCTLDLRQDDVDALQALYLDSADWYSQDKKRVTNKSLALHEHAGFLNLVLPDARMILLHRHPLDNCISCHMTNLLANGHAYTSDLSNLGKMWVIRRQLQDHWRETLELKVMDLHYEKLVESQESETRRLLEFLDIPWEDGCLQFHKSKRIAATISHDQVNKKMYKSSSGRWKNYEKHIGPLIEEVKDYLD